jgi:hypothetical protein
MYENRENDFRMLKKEGLTLNMSMSVSGQPDMDNKLTDIVVKARQALVPQGLSDSESKKRCTELALMMDSLDIHDVGCCQNDPR